jgi:succinylglutamate desuccinylase
MQDAHFIGAYEGEQHGALFFVVTTLHGNEPAGAKAVESLLRLLQAEKNKNPNFEFHGKIVGLIGNSAASAKNKRYIDTDMNRLWQSDRIKFIEAQPTDRILLAEEREARELLATIRTEIAAYQPTELFFLDLHTTTAEGGIFTIVPSNTDSERIGLTLFATMITGFASLLQGTLMDFFNGKFEDLKSTTLTFESGQHNDPESVTNAVSAIINVLRAIGCVHPHDVEDKHDARLRERAAQLPRVAELMYRHELRAGDSFKMRPGYHNFQPVAAKEILAEDRTGVIRAKNDALILMPLYQQQGNDGFFLVKPIQ